MIIYIDREPILEFDKQEHRQLIRHVQQAGQEFPRGVGSSSKKARKFLKF